MMGGVELGLDQKLSMPTDSYVIKYFDSLDKYLSVGPPVYFVMEGGHDYSTVRGQNMICGGQGCPSQSLLGQVYEASLQPNGTRIAHPASSWLDDYFDWIAPGGNPPCCRDYKDNGDFCPSTIKKKNVCEACKVREEHGRPVQQDFMKHLPWYLSDNPGTTCAKGGHAAYGSAVELIAPAHNTSKLKIGATYFMSYHTILKGNNDFISALKWARNISENITNTLNNWQTAQHNISSPEAEKIHVFPYSIFYVYYEQYLTIVHDSIVNLSLSGAAIFLVTFVLLGFDLWSAMVIIVTIMMILLSMFSLMNMWNITLNAISLVNLVMTVGISVEFCSHIARAFSVSVKDNRVERAKEALVNMGSSVLSGITLTKLGGIIVLAFSKSQLFQVFYFRMYLGIVIFGAVHGLIFLPVFLSYYGPSINKARILQVIEAKVLHTIQTDDDDYPSEDSRDNSNLITENPVSVIYQGT